MLDGNDIQEANIALKHTVMEIIYLLTVFLAVNDFAK